MFFLPRVIAGVALVGAAGCATGPGEQPPIAPPAVAAQVRNYIGTPLSGALATNAASIEASDALYAKVTFIALEKMPATVFAPLGPRVRLLVATREGTPVLPTGRLTLGVRFEPLDHADAILSELKAGKFGRSAIISTQDGALLRGATASFVIEDQQGAPDVIPGQSVVRRVSVELYRPQSQASETADTHNHVEIGLAVDDFINPEAPQDFGGAFAPRREVSNGSRSAAGRPATPPPPPPTPVYQSEVALFTQPADHAAFSLFIPIHFQDAPTQAVVAVVEISGEATDKTHLATVERTIEDLKSTSAAVAAWARPVGGDPVDWPGLSSTIESLAWSGRQRAGLSYLAAQTDAQITQDVVLAAGESTLSRLADEVTKEMSADGASRDRKSIGWMLERTTLKMLLQMQISGKLPSELAAILALRAGEAGRHAETLEEVLSSATGQQDLQNRLAAENYIFLEDSSPASRVRAFDWLWARQLAPAGYDPLGNSKQRRAALEEAEDAAATQPSAP